MPVETTVRRRWYAFGAITVSGALVLSACGGEGGSGDNGDDDGPSRTSEELLEERGVSGDLEEVYDINPVDRDDLTQGGQLTLASGSQGPNWNGLTNAGNEASTGTIRDVFAQGGCWKSDALGDPVLFEEFCLNVEQELIESDDEDEPPQQIIHFELNPEAVWNDGTPIDFHTYEHTLHIRSGQASEELIEEHGEETDVFDLVATTMYDQVESIEMGDDEWSFTVTMEEIYQPFTSLFSGGLVHPDIPADDPEIFNEGFHNDVRNEWRAGPYVVDIYDRAANVVSVVPNENWWGEESILDRINFVQYEASANIQAFQNQEIDVVSVSTAERLEEMNSWQEPGDEWEIRRGQRMFRGGMVFNIDSPQINDVAIREAIFTAIDRDQLNEIRYQGLNWEEEPPGGWMVMAFDERYEDAYPIPEEDRGDADVAAQILEDAGYTRDSEDDYFVDEDGEEVVVNYNTFGDDTTGEAIAQSFQTMIRAAGINLEIDNRPSAEFAEAVGSRDFVIGSFGYTASADPTAFVRQILSCEESNLSGACSEELDEEILEVPWEAELDDRIALAQDIEQRHHAEHFAYLGLQNGPDIFAVRTGLANYGPRLFETTDWINVGWEADADADGTDTGVDADDLEDTDPDEDIPEDDEEDGEE